MKLRGKRVAVLAQNLYQEVQLWVPYYRLREEGVDVKFVGPNEDKAAERYRPWLISKNSVYTSLTGYPVTVDLLADAVRASELDGVIVPGGFGADRMRLTPGMVHLVREAHQQGKLIAGIGHGGWVLLSAGILRGKRVTSAPAIKDDLVHAGASWVDAEVVVDGNLVTSRAPDDVPAFCREVVKALSKH